MSCARRRRLAAVAVLLQREVAVPRGTASSGGGARAGDRCRDIDWRAQSDCSGVRKYAAKAAASPAS